MFQDGFKGRIECGNVASSHGKPKLSGPAQRALVKAKRAERHTQQPPKGPTRAFDTTKGVNPPRMK